MPRPGGGATGGGLSGEQLAGSCFHAFCHAIKGQGGTAPEWEKLDESLQHGFVAAAGFVEGFLSGERDEGGSWKALAAQCYLEYCKAAAETPQALEAIPPDTLLAWEAFARHASNMMDMDETDAGEGAVSHEEYWNEWAKNRKAQSTMPQQQVEAQRPIEEDV